MISISCYVKVVRWQLSTFGRLSCCINVDCCVSLSFFYASPFFLKKDEFLEIFVFDRCNDMVKGFI